MWRLVRIYAFLRERPFNFLRGGGEAGGLEDILKTISMTKFCSRTG